MKQSGGTVDKVDIWGRRRLSFEINKKSEGIYAVLDLSCTPAEPCALDRLLKYIQAIDYKDTPLLRKCMSDRGKHKKRKEMYTLPTPRSCTPTARSVSSRPSVALQPGHRPHRTDHVHDNVPQRRFTSPSSGLSTTVLARTEPCPLLSSRRRLRAVGAKS